MQLNAFTTDIAFTTLQALSNLETNFPALYGFDTNLFCHSANSLYVRVVERQKKQGSKAGWVI